MRELPTVTESATNNPRGRASQLIEEPPIQATVVPSLESRAALAEPPRLSKSIDPVAAVWLCGSVVCITLAALMRVGDYRRVFLYGFDTPIPETCFAYSQWGIDCPGCGLTRAFVWMAHGRIDNAWLMNPVGIALFIFVLAQIPFRLTHDVFRRRSRLTIFLSRWNDSILACLLVALILQWLVRMSL